MAARTVTTRVLMARAREHGHVLTTLGDAVEWSGMAWPEVVADPEWVYNAAARDACTAAARCLEVELRGVSAAPRRSAPGGAARLRPGWLGAMRVRGTR